MKPSWCLWIAFLLGPVLAQETDAPTPDEKKTEGPDPHVLFSRAVLAFRGSGDLVATASIKHEKGPAGAAGAAFGGQVIIRGFAGTTGGAPYEGDVEAWRGADGATVIVSRKGLPGFGLYMDLDRTIKRTTFEEKSHSLGELESQLAPILDADNFSKYILGAKLEARRDEATGDFVFTGPVSKKLVRQPAQGHNVAGVVVSSPFGVKRPLRCEARLVVSPQGRFKEIEVKVVHNDPMAKALKGRQIVIRGGAWGKVEPEKEKKDGKEKEGGSTVYTVKLDATGPSERARAFKRDVRRLVQAEGK